LSSEHAKEVADEEYLLNNFLLFARLEDLERWPIEELGLDDVV